MPTPAAGTIGSLDYTAEERQVLAKKSKCWECDICGKISEKLSSQTNSMPKLTQEETSLIQQIALKVFINFYFNLLLSEEIIKT